MKTQTNLSSLLLISFALFFQMGCGSNITKMIDQLSLDPQYVKLSKEKDPKKLKESQDTLSTVKEKLHDITKGQGDPNEDITLNNQQPSTLLELMIELEGEAGVQFPNKLFKYLRTKGMDIEKPITITEEVIYGHYDRNDCSPLYYAIQWSAANIARWLLETGADVSTVTSIDTSDLWVGTYTSVDDKVALLDALAKHGFNFNNLASWPIHPLVVDKDISVAAKVKLLTALAKHGFNFKNVTSWPIYELVIHKDISVDDKIHLLNVLHNYGVDLRKIHVSSQQDSFVTVLPPHSTFIINFLFSPPYGHTEDISDDEITGKVRLLDALVQHGCSFNAADKMGYIILSKIINYRTYASNIFTRYSIKCLKKILTDQKYCNLKTKLYETFFTTENYVGASNPYLPWEAAVANGNIELAVLLIKEIKSEDVKTKSLIDKNGKELEQAGMSLTQLDRIQTFETRFPSLSCADRQKIRQAFPYIGITDVELAT